MLLISQRLFQFLWRTVKKKRINSSSFWDQTWKQWPLFFSLATFLCPVIIENTEKASVIWVLFRINTQFLYKSIYVSLNGSLFEVTGHSFSAELVNLLSWLIFSRLNEWHEIIQKFRSLPGIHLGTPYKMVWVLFSASLQITQKLIFYFIAEVNPFIKCNEISFATNHYQGLDLETFGITCCDWYYFRCPIFVLFKQKFLLSKFAVFPTHQVFCCLSIALRSMCCDWG